MGAAIDVTDLGIRFRRNRRGRRSFKDLFSSSKRRNRPGEFWALRNVTFSVQTGEAIGVVGRNGQGKSTLLKLVAAGLHGMSRAEIAERFDTIIDFAELQDFLDTPYKHLSNGMKVRLAFAVVSQLDEPILLVDEVLAVGDKAFRDKCYQRIDELLAEGRTLFFVSHNERDLRRFCTRGLLFHKGKLAADGPIGDVLDAYNALSTPPAA